MNYTDLQASIGRVQLQRQQEFYSIRLEVAKQYYKSLQNFPLEIKCQSNIIHPNHSRHLFMIQLPIKGISITRDELLLELRKQNIGASIHYPPLHLMPFYVRNGQMTLPHTDSICDRIMTLPISASMTLEDAEYVIFHLKECMK
jgi:dTDP-4-amino-4,6-dideoxygalactose transaminase